MSSVLDEDPTNEEKKSLAVHVGNCHLRYKSISEQLRGIKKILWVVALILLSSAIATNIGIWSLNAH